MIGLWSLPSGVPQCHFCLKTLLTPPEGRAAASGAACLGFGRCHVLLVSNKGEKLYIEKSLLSAVAHFFLISDEGTQSGPRELGCSQNSRCPVTKLVPPEKSLPATPSCTKMPTQPQHPGPLSFTGPWVLFITKNVIWGGSPFLLYSLNTRRVKKMKR